MKAVYKFYWDCGRQGSLEGIFIEDTRYVKQLVGKEVYFGEVLGKHSEIYGTLDEGDIELISEDPVIIKFFEDNDVSTGFNPIETILDNSDYDGKSFVLSDGTKIKDLNP